MIADLKKMRQLDSFYVDFAAAKDGAQPGLYIVDDFDAQKVVQEQTDVDVGLS